MRQNNLKQTQKRFLKKFFKEQWMMLKTETKLVVFCSFFK